MYERLASYLWEAGEHAAAEQAYREAATLLAGAPPSATAARVLAVQASSLVCRGHYAEGLVHGREPLAMARSVGATAEAGRALNWIGVALTVQGEVAEGARTLREAVRIADAAGLLEDLYRAYGNLVFVLARERRPPGGVGGGGTGRAGPGAARRLGAPAAAACRPAMRVPLLSSSAGGTRRPR